MNNKLQIIHSCWIAFLYLISIFLLSVSKTDIDIFSLHIFIVILIVKNILFMQKPLSFSCNKYGFLTSMCMLLYSFLFIGQQYMYIGIFAIFMIFLRKHGLAESDFYSSSFDTNNSSYTFENNSSNSSDDIIWNPIYSNLDCNIFHRDD